MLGALYKGPVKFIALQSYILLYNLCESYNLCEWTERYFAN